MKRIINKTALSALLLLSCASTFAANANWYVSVGGGEQFPEYDSSVNVNNGSGFAPPNDQDIYYTRKDDQAVVAASAGYRWGTDDKLLSAVSVGVFYQYFFKQDAGCCIDQYSAPGFTNYHYNWNIHSNVVLAYSKVDFYRFDIQRPYLLSISPFINLGIGAAFNTSDYNETALPGITPRTSPGFRSRTASEFAYNAGLGLDFDFTRRLIFSVAYQYMNLGSFKTGNGTLGWSNQSLRLEPYQSNEVFVSLSYLI